MKRRLSSTVLTIGLVWALAASNFVRADDDEYDDDDIEDSLPDAVTDADFYDDGKPSAAKVELGRALFWDKILSGNLHISCATCHHTLTDTGDGLSLPIGEGGNGLGIARDTGTVVERVPRNAPPVFNRGARVFVRMFHDARVEVDASQPSGFATPAGDYLPSRLDNVLAAQAMFPVTSPTEMAGQKGENPIANAAAASTGDPSKLQNVWDQLAKRLQKISTYEKLFAAAYGIDKTDITFVHAANAIAAYEATAFRADNSPFDAYLRGDSGAMSQPAKRGMQLFYGEAGCADCHSGKFQTDMEFHAIAMPQIGPGKGDGLDGHDDFGRERVTGHYEDRYRFLTPSLRNVALTGPWGHAGAYNSLRAAVEHHLDTTAGLKSYYAELSRFRDFHPQAVLPSRKDLDALDFVVLRDDSSRSALAASSELAPIDLSNRELDDLIAFLHALTDTNSVDLRSKTPRSVPSGLPLAD